MLWGSRWLVYLLASQGCRVTLQEISGVEQVAPLFLLGADILWGFRAKGLTFSAIHTKTTDNTQAEGFLKFEWGTKFHMEKSMPPL